MEKYRNRKNSGIAAFEIGADFIRVQFSDSMRIYTYSYRSAGMEHVETMKDLARQGSHLNTYISQHVKDLYE